MEQPLTHWRRLVNPMYLGAYSLMDGDTPHDLTVKITKVVREQVKGEGGKSEECTVAYLENQKPLILNRTNCKTIESLYRTPYTEKWVGCLITLFVSETKVAGNKVDCLRIRAVKPQIAATVTLDVTKEIGQINACTELSQLAVLYTSFSKELQHNAQIIASKDAMKATLTPQA
tara:strand:- start:591 stop:1112 length:522 start_codon:yes stop_codon:yes gene_type:complete